MGTIITTIKEEIPYDEELRKNIYIPIIEKFEDCDWDTQDECLGIDPVYDLLYNELYGDYE